MKKKLSETEQILEMLQSQFDTCYISLYKDDKEVHKFMIKEELDAVIRDIYKTLLLRRFNLKYLLGNFRS